MDELVLGILGSVLTIITVISHICLFVESDRTLKYLI